MSLPGIFLMVTPALDPPWPSKTTTALAVTAQTPGFNAYICVQATSCRNNDFTTITTALALFPAGSNPMVRIIYCGGPFETGRGYPTIQLPISLYNRLPAPMRTYGPLWHPALISDYEQGWTNLLAYLAANNITMHSYTMCPCGNSPYDGEFFSAPSNQNVPTKMDFSPYWIGTTPNGAGCVLQGGQWVAQFGPLAGQVIPNTMNYSEDNVVAGLATLAGFFYNSAPTIPSSFVMPVATQQKLGFLPDKTASFADRMWFAMAAVNPMLTAEMDSWTSDVKIAGPKIQWAVNKGLNFTTPPRLAIQIAADVSGGGKDLNAIYNAMASGLALGNTLVAIEANELNALPALNYLAIVNNAPITTLGDDNEILTFGSDNEILSIGT